MPIFLFVFFLSENSGWCWLVGWCVLFIVKEMEKKEKKPNGAKCTQN